MIFLTIAGDGGGNIGLNIFLFILIIFYFCQITGFLSSGITLACTTGGGGRCGHSGSQHGRGFCRRRPRRGQSLFCFGGDQRIHGAVSLPLRRGSHHYLLLLYYRLLLPEGTGLSTHFKCIYCTSSYEVLIFLDNLSSLWDRLPDPTWRKTSVSATLLCYCHHAYTILNIFKYIYLLDLIQTASFLIERCERQVPLVIFKREKDVARRLEFDGLYVTEQPPEEDIKGQWDRLVINTPYVQSH